MRNESHEYQLLPGDAAAESDAGIYNGPEWMSRKNSRFQADRLVCLLAIALLSITNMVFISKYLILQGKYYNLRTAHLSLKDQYATSKAHMHIERSPYGIRFNFCSITLC